MNSIDSSPREKLLHEALTIVTKDRNQQYGSPEDSFSAIAGAWNWYLTNRLAGDLTSSDVAAMMILFKIARLTANSQHRDSILDIAGYAACMEDCRVAAAGFSSSPPSSVLSERQK